MAFPSERGTANATLVDPSDPPTVSSARGTVNVTLFDPAGETPIVQSLRGTKNVTLFDPAPDAVVFPSARGTANATLIPALGEDTSLRICVVDGGEFSEPQWFRFVARVSGSWVFL